MDYSDDQKKEFAKWAKKNGVESPIFVKSAQDVVNYINSQDISTKNLSEERKNDQISDLSAFAHGVESTIAFGLENNGVNSQGYDPTDFRIDEANQLDPGAFKVNSKIDLQSCNPATPENYQLDYKSMKDLKDDLLDKPSLVSKLSTQTGGTVSGKIGSTFYPGGGKMPQPGRMGTYNSPTVNGEKVTSIIVTYENGKRTSN